MVAFCPQDDIMFRDLTVKENLSLYAHLRLPKKMNHSEINQVIEDIIYILGLYPISHSIIGDEVKRGISGGQCKRVNIGMEMVADPSLLFLDEPTSGLDSTTSYAVMSALKALSKKGSNIIVILHQPSFQIYEMFDDVIFLAKGGRTVFIGEACDALSFFTNIGFTCPHFMNPAGMCFIYLRAYLYT